jgi:DNA-binding transcriptional regulator GbsR (MarR family)
MTENDPHPGESQKGVLEGLDAELAAQLPTFEQFFKTFGFKRVHGRIWGLLVLIGRPLSAKEIQVGLSLSQGATSQALKQLEEWGAITTEFDSQRRCHLHAPVSNTLSIAATVIRRREQVAFQQFKAAASRTLAYVTERYGERDPRVMTLRSIVSTCEIAEAVIQLVVGSVANALDDSQSLLHRAVSTALKVGFAMPSKLLQPSTTKPSDGSSIPAKSAKRAPIAAKRAAAPAVKANASSSNPSSANASNNASNKVRRG